MSDLTDKLYFYTALKCKKDGITDPRIVKILYKTTKTAYYNGTADFKQALAKDMEKYFE